MVSRFLTNWNLIFLLIIFFHFLSISWAMGFCNVWTFTCTEKKQTGYVVSTGSGQTLQQAPKLPESDEIMLPNQLLRIYYYRIYTLGTVLISVRLKILEIVLPIFSDFSDFSCNTKICIGNVRYQFATKLFYVIKKWSASK